MDNNHAGSVTSTHPAKLPIKTAKMTVLKVIRKYWIFYIMMLPTIVFLLINNYLPMAGVIIAFKNINYADGFFASPWVGFDNFKYLFKTDDAYLITRNTVLYNALFITLNLVIPAMFAILLNELRRRFMAKLHTSIMFLPFFLSPVIISYLVYAFLGDKGFLTSTLFPLFNLEPVMWYFETTWWPYILPIVNTWKNVGYYTVFYMAAIVGIDDEYYEAATIDGAGKIQQMWKITIPLIAPVMIILTLLQIGRIFYADFGLFFLIPRESGPLFPVTNVIDTYVYRTFLTLGDIGLSSAAGLYQAVVGFILVFGSNWIVRKINQDNALF